MTHDRNSFIAERVSERQRLEAVLPVALIKSESSAARMRWHAYRFMSALDCTPAVLARDYSAVYRSTFGLGAAIWCEPESEHFATLWRMRQAADDTQIPHAAYLETSVVGLRAKDLNRYKSPQLEFVRHQTQVSWHRRYLAGVRADLSRWTLAVAEIPEFRFDNDCGLPSQMAFRSAVCRPLPNVSLAAE